MEANNIIVKFGDLVAVNNISMSIEEGEIYGLLGPNGAGKTTTIRVLSTLLRPTAGKVSISGYPIPEESYIAKSYIGMVQQQISLDKELTVEQNIRYHALLHKIPLKEIRTRIDDLSGLLGFREFLDRPVVELSGGWKKRVAIVCAIIHRPKILFLDEPTAGLDTQSRYMLWDLIRTLNHHGTTILITTHYIDEAENLCGKVGIVKKGEMVATGSPQELCASIGTFLVELVSDDNSREYLYFKTLEDAKKYAGLEERQSIIRKTSLEDVYLEITGREAPTEAEEIIRV
jgi:ABC-2 type transport system ATP-binding protein